MRALAVVLATTLLLAACGSGAKTLTVEAVVSTKPHTTFRFATTAKIDGVSIPPYTGAADSHGDASIVEAQPGVPGEADIIFADHQIFNRVKAPTPGLSHDWCIEQHVTRSAGSDVSPIDTLTNLHVEGKTVHRIGDDSVRGVSTVHYGINGENPPVDIWVDTHDLLRRLRWTHGKAHQTDIVEIYDYGTPVSIAVPRNAKPCPMIPSGLLKPGECILGKSYRSPPMCPKTTETSTSNP